MRNKFAWIILCFLMTGCFTDQQCVCPEIWSPVCGKNGQTYSNPCSAECDDMEYIEGECPVYGIGEVVFSGDSTCGFYVQVLNTTYKPQNLPVGFEEHGVIVSLRYRRMNTYFTCDQPYGNHQEIQILEMDKIN